MSQSYSFDLTGFEQGDITFLSSDTCKVEIWFDFEIDGLAQDEMFQVYSKLLKSKDGEAYDWAFYEQGYVNREEVKNSVHFFYRDGHMSVIENVLSDVAALADPQTGIIGLSGEKKAGDVTLSFTLPSGNLYMFEFEGETLKTMEVSDPTQNFAFYIKQLPQQEKLISYLMNESNQRLLFVC